MKLSTFSCEKCSSTYTRKNDLLRHVLNNKCKIQCATKINERFICAKCSFLYSRKHDLLRHINSDNCNKTKTSIKDGAGQGNCSKIQDGILKLSFDTKDEFLQWKDSEEQKTRSKFLRDTREWKTKYAIKARYRCHQAGYVRTKDQSIRKRNLKRKGSCKIDNYCTAYILYEELNEGKILVEYNPKHCNHSIEIKHLPLSSNDKVAIAGRLTEGVPLNRILQDVRKTLTDSAVTRTMLITKHELHNIAAEFKISFQERLSTIDVVSVDMLIDEYYEKFKEDSPFRYYKKHNVEDPDGVFDKKDILLVIMDPIQIQNLKKFGSEKICIDSTHSTTDYEYLLTTLLVVNDLDMGVPVAYAISNKENASFIKRFFEVIKENAGIITTNTFMSDDCPTYLNAWKEVMGTPENTLLCIWHVDKNWRKNLNKINSRLPELQKQVYKLIRTLMEETIEAHFPDIVDQATKKLLENPETKEFGKYFRREYSSRYQMWAFAFRKHIGLNTKHETGESSSRIETCLFQWYQKQAIGCFNRHSFNDESQ